MRRMLGSTSLVAVPVILALLGVAPVSAQVDCSNPDNLCTGDPCVVPKIKVASPCVADFGNRTVVVSGPLELPTSPPFCCDGVLSLSAGAIDVQGVILRASNITLVAGGDVRLRRPLKARGSAGADPTITLSAGGSVQVDGSITSRWYTPPIVSIDAGDDITVAGAIIAHFSGKVFLSAGGDIAIDRSVNVNDQNLDFGFAGEVTIDAGGSVSIGRQVLARGEGGSSGNPKVTISGAGGVVVERGILVGTSPFDGSNYPTEVTVSSSLGDVRISKRLQALPHGDIRVSAGGTATLDARTLAGWSTGPFPPGYPNSTAQIRVSASTVVMDGVFATTDGIIEAAASGNLTAGGEFRAAPDGCIALTAGGTLDTSAATFDLALSGDCPGSPSGAFLETSATLVE